MSSFCPGSIPGRCSLIFFCFVRPGSMPGRCSHVRGCPLFARARFPDGVPMCVVVLFLPGLDARTVYPCAWLSSFCPGSIPGRCSRLFFLFCDPGSIPGRCTHVRGCPLFARARFPDGVVVYFFLRFCVFFFCFLRPDQYPNDPPGVFMVQLVKLHRRSLSSTVRCASSRPAPTVQSQLLYSRMHDEGLRIDHTPFSNGQTTYPESPPAREV